MPEEYYDDVVMMDPFEVTDTYVDDLYDPFYDDLFYNDQYYGSEFYFYDDSYYNYGDDVVVMDPYVVTVQTPVPQEESVQESSPGLIEMGGYIFDSLGRVSDGSGNWYDPMTDTIYDSQGNAWKGLGDGRYFNSSTGYIYDSKTGQTYHETSFMNNPVTPPPQVKPPPLQDKPPLSTPPKQNTTMSRPGSPITGGTSGGTIASGGAKTSQANDPLAALFNALGNIFRPTSTSTSRPTNSLVPSGASGSSSAYRSPAALSPASGQTIPKNPLASFGGTNSTALITGALVIGGLILLSRNKHGKRKSA